MQKIKVLETLASNMVGDGKKPNLFFVSVQGKIVSISRDIKTSYEYWKTLSYNNNLETALEDRQHGVLATVQPENDNKNARLERLDDVPQFYKNAIW